MHNLHHQLAGLDGRQHIHAQCLLLHGVCEVLGNFIVDVGVEECAAHVLQRLGNVDLSNLSLALQNLERAFQSLR